MEQDSNNEAKNSAVPTTETGNIKLNADFTPGPWDAINESSEYASSLAESHWYIAADNDGMDLAVTIGDCVDEEAANARLIAAAPALYAALKEILNYGVEFEHADYVCAQIDKEAIKDARAALALASGGK